MALVGSQQHSTANRYLVKTLSILRENVEAAVKAMKMEKSLGTDSIAAELVKAGVVTIIERLT